MPLEPQAKSRHRSTCHRHPAEPVTGFCALCLRERLAGIDSSAGSGGGDDQSGTSAASSSLHPEIRRCKSYAALKCGASSGVSEPRRKSCDVRDRHTLSRLFNLDDEESNGLNKGSNVESKNLGFSGVTVSVIESRVEVIDGGKNRVSQDALGQDEEAEEEQKTMKEHIELEYQSRKHNARDLKDIAGSFWLAASVFSQKLRKLKLNQRMKKLRRGRRGGGGGDSPPAEKLNARRTQSEVGDYGFGRRSCDTDPRISTDAYRVSFDDPSLSSDEPRASWDGYMIARTIPRLAPMLSVIENAMNRSECGVIEEQVNSINEIGTTSGRDYCSDSSSSQRRNSFDCSSSSRSSNKKTVALEVDEMKSMSNVKVSPRNIVVTDRDAKELDLNSLKYEHSEGFESACKDAKKLVTWRKAWKILGFMHKPVETKCGKVEGNGISHTMEDCSEEQNGVANGVVNGASSEKLGRSGSCVGSRSSQQMIGSYNRSLSVAENRDTAKKGRDESALDRNLSTNYSPSNFDNGLLRFHLTPSWSCPRKSGRSKAK
ncbi:protein OCTOPUS-like [Actinidia eriantha]|uniref:protein OCTOPUS-like n=1 Tax=Actinidia eriantha TaxID=165200 RepID=UPI002585A1F4|nr:protein OCTOPUS-like [Actinidia eriantha]